MLNILELLVRYWELHARFEREELTDAERAELWSWLQLLNAHGAAGASEGQGWRASGDIPVQLTTGSGFLAGVVREFRPDGLIIGAAESIPRGSRTVAYLADALSGIEYSLPCVIAWAQEGEPWVMGLALDGVPARAELTAPLGALMRSPLRFAAARAQAQ